MRRRFQWGRGMCAVCRGVHFVFFSVNEKKVWCEFLWSRVAPPGGQEVWITDWSRGACTVAGCFRRYGRCLHRLSGASGAEDFEKHFEQKNVSKAVAAAVAGFRPGLDLVGLEYTLLDPGRAWAPPIATLTRRIFLKIVFMPFFFVPTRFLDVFFCCFCFCEHSF